MSKRKKRRFEGYSGGRAYTVKHPEHSETVKVYAPDADAAIVAAAVRWGEQWTKYDFYSLCTVERI